MKEEDRVVLRVHLGSAEGPCTHCDAVTGELWAWSRVTAPKGDLHSHLLSWVYHLTPRNHD